MICGHATNLDGARRAATGWAVHGQPPPGWPVRFACGPVRMSIVSAHIRTGQHPQDAYLPAARNNTETRRSSTRTDADDASRRRPRSPTGRVVLAGVDRPMWVMA